ncbi:solute carrier family 25 member 38 [Hyphopichia burtonii NRRL Y-1933]|uniref:Mitochondrial glycine transporter n=1 Tax=Hyphopichia burtonii NRRL Y-1933 TaxID=984485 RepID=A0A1E4RMR2_9ASCO|nr:solute carrier family 25 member 38 [Hyphopichia burtonii NRRL Y-1933]ODV68552.1 solute carrier family 25 member 38 [Hyphopichia burtonii NRRL Y-1933]
MSSVVVSKSLTDIPDSKVELPIRQESKPSTKTHLISGGIAGLISATTLQPFDLLKTRLQQQQQQEIGYRTTISKELKKLTQVKDLWRGALPSTLRTSIGAGLYFTILSQSRSYLSSIKGNHDTRSSTSALPKLSPIENLATGFVVRAIVGFITMPITIIKTRYESNIYNYNSMYEGFENIYHGNSLTDPENSSKGSIKNFFKGSFATLARDCPYAGLYVLFYESFKNDLLPTFTEKIDDLNRPTVINTISAILAASVSTTLTAPFDAIKTRLQLTLSSNKSFLSTTKVLLNEDGGFRNLFRGLSLRLSRKGMSAGISWCIYEELIKGNFFNSNKLL